MKRTCDLVLGSVLLLFALPGLAAVAISIKLTSPGPVLFRQERIGKDDQPFTIYKLRTMAHDAEQKLSQLAESNEMDGPLFKIREDPRVFAFGRFLRRTSLDELPQLLNVIRGQMSLSVPGPSCPRRPDSSTAGPTPFRGPARTDRTLAGLGSQRPDLRASSPARLSLCGIVVAVVGLPDSVDDAGSSIPRARSLLTSDRRSRGVVHHGQLHNDFCAVRAASKGPRTQLVAGGPGGASRLERTRVLRAALLVERPARARRASFNVTADRKAAACNGEWRRSKRRILFTVRAVQSMGFSPESPPIWTALASGT